MPRLPESIHRAAAGLRAGEWSAEELLDLALMAARDRDPELGVFVTRTHDLARRTAREVDARLAAGAQLPDLAGIPIGVKDVFATADAPTSAQSRVPPPVAQGSDAELVARLRGQGALMVGKTTTMEYALGLPDPDNPHPLPRNPWDPSRWTGGSSSGSASGIAAGMFLGALGTDSAGSIRMPAAWCGVVGFKPTHGLLDLDGVVPLAPSLDHAGPLGATVEDCGVLMAALVPYWRPHRPLPSLHGVRIGVIARPPLPVAADTEVLGLFDDAVVRLERAGASIDVVDLPCWLDAHEACMDLLALEAHEHLAHGLGPEPPQLGASVLAFLSRSTGPDATFRQRLLTDVRRMRHEVAALLDRVDVVATPTALQVAPLAPGFDAATNSLQMCTKVWSLVGNPAISLPAGRTRSGLPTGLQLATRRGDDARLLAIAQVCASKM